MPKRHLWLLGFSALVLALGAGLFLNSPGRRASPNVIRVGCIPIADCAQLYVALDKGYFREEGLRVELTSLSGGAKILEALGAGSLDVGFSNVVSLILARDAGLPFVALTGGPAEDEEHREHAILVAADSPLQAVSDLAGKRIALNTRKNIDDLMVTLLLRKHHVDPSAVKFVEVPFPRMLGVLKAGDVDAVAAIEPFVTVGTSEGARVLSYNYVEVQPLTYVSVYAASREWTAKHAGAADAFTRAIARSTRHANAHGGEVREILSRYTQLDPSLLKRIVLPRFLEVPTEEALTGMIQRVVDMGWIRAPFPAADLLPSKP